jgi:hypothetical protein
VKRLLVSISLISVLAAVLPLRAADGPAANQRVMDRTRLTEKLRAAGARVERRGSAEQPFLSVKGVMFKVYGEDVQVFQYRNAADADTQAAAVSPDGGTVGTTKIHWIGRPHFYKEGRLLVLYLGDEPKVLKALEAVLGRQFAGK